MNRVCRGAVSLDSKFSEAVDRASGSSNESFVELMVLPRGGVSGRGVEVLMACT